ncbi:MAG TPA: 30S ribosomal protein S20 [bacterium]|nr:30S ribosomal protein S20 [bacterium]
MPLHGSAAKRHRQSEKRRLRNKMVKTRVRSSTRRFLEFVDEKAGEEAQNQYREVSSLLDRAVSKGVLHKNTAARKKRRLHKMLVSLR